MVRVCALQMVEHRVVGGTHPWYVFKGHPIPRESDDKPDSFVKVLEPLRL